MKKTNKIILPLLGAAIIAALGACGSNKAPPPTKEPIIDAAHTTRNSVDWAGQYTGLIPAADGPGIEVQITLGEDGTYELTYSYVDRDTSFQVTGNFTWDEGGSIITLDDKDLPPYYRVGERTLTQLDMEGNEITGLHAGLYVLKKVIAEEPAL